MTSKSNDSLTFLGSKIFKIDEAEFIFGHRLEHIEIMRLFFGNMCKEEICFAREKSSFIHLFHTHQDIAIAKIFFKRDIEIFIFFSGIASVIAWLDKEFNIGIKLLESHNLRWSKRHSPVGRILRFT